MILRKQRTRYGVQVPLTSLIDIVFLLLIYFLLTTNFMVEQGIDVNLPKAKASAAQKHQEVTVYIDREGCVYLGKTKIEFNDLFDRLQERIQETPNGLVVIKADRSVSVDRAVQLMDMARSAGAGRLFLATARDH